MNPPVIDPATTARQKLNAARRLGTAEAIAFKDLDQLTKDDDGYIEPKELLEFGSTVAAFDKALEDRGRRPRLVPREAVDGRRPLDRAAAVIAIVAGVVAIVGGINLPSGGLLLIGVGAGRRRHRHGSSCPAGCRR